AELGDEEQTCGIRDCRDHPKRNITARSRRVSTRVRRQWSTSGRPRFAASGFNTAHGGAANFYPGVAPRIQASRRLTCPRLTDAQTGHEGHIAIDDDRFPMITTEPGQRTI